jgi:hypothetical protein
MTRAGRGGVEGLSTHVRACLHYRPASGEVPVAVQVALSETALTKVSRKPDEEMEVKRLERNVRVEVVIIGAD